jgi:competence protein ComEC
MKKKPYAFLWLVISAVEILLILFCVRELSVGANGHLSVRVLDVGQGDSILLRSPSGKQVLIDGGPDLTTLTRLAENMPFLDRTIELLVLTHPDLDHFASFPEILRRYKVERVLMTGIEKSDARYQELLSLIKQKRAAVILADPSKDIDLGDGVVLDVVWPKAGLLGVRPPDTNDTGIVLRALYKGQSILFTADIEKKAEEALLKTGADIDADIIKVGHHGSRTSSSTGFLLAVTPKLSLISAGRDNSYGHPHADVMERYRYFHIPVRVTAHEGTLAIELE